MNRRNLAACVLVGGWLVAASFAVPVHVEVTGTVDFNGIGGGMAGISSGAPVVMGFDVDSTDYVNSPNFPTRGYPIILSSWAMSVGGVGVPIVDPQPFGTAYFVLRNNDPAVDGFLVSRNIDVPQPITVTIPGLAPQHELDFLRTFNDGTPLPSLDILDAVGTYGLQNLSVYGWGIGRFGTHGAEYAYESISITPEPGTLALVALGMLVAGTRRR